MNEIIFGMSIGGAIFCAGRLLDIAWPTKIQPWPIYAVMGSVWFGLLVIFHH